ncbi:MAG: TPM domain-containing protein [Verrucomicrobiaceae bacterium]|nr:TPM domain-containing protein [Verrucomicrobiaceae bacterium]
MRCPACQSPVFENDAACRQCGFTLEAADRVFGVPPALHKPLTDPGRVLSMLARRRLEKCVARIEHHYPQVEVAVLLLEVPAQAPLGVYAFWLFNRGQLSSAVEKGGENRLVMLLVDLQTERAVVMAGYGLEPFLPESQLVMCLNRFSQQARRGGLADGIDGFLNELDLQFKTVLRQVSRQFGLAEDDSWQGLDENPAGEKAITGSLY